LHVSICFHRLALGYPCTAPWLEVQDELLAAKNVLVNCVVQLSRETEETWFLGVADGAIVLVIGTAPGPERFDTYMSSFKVFFSGPSLEGIGLSS
jgi:hypothetical protein